jgi:Tfp pilus assembly protein PilF
MRLFVILLVIVPLISGCETVRQGIKDIKSKFEPETQQPQATPERSAEDLLAAGVKQYEDGNYAQAERLLRSSLAEGLSARKSQARAHKHLAFIYCVTNRIAQCRQEFLNAKTADPDFALSAAEVGHPTWGPVYRSTLQGR